jgi:hypothetical protein
MFELNWTDEALRVFRQVEHAAKKAKENREKREQKKSSAQEGLFNQVVKTLKLLRENPRHPGLETHPYQSLSHPWSKTEKVFEAYVQNNTPGAYRIFWCYGPEKKMITILTITQHP